MAKRYNKETAKAAQKISGFLSPDGEEYTASGVLEGPLVRIIVKTPEGAMTYVRWILGVGWVQAGTGNGSDYSKTWRPIIGKPSYLNN